MKDGVHMKVIFGFTVFYRKNIRLEISKMANYMCEEKAGLKQLAYENVGCGL